MLTSFFSRSGTVQLCIRKIGMTKKTRGQKAEVEEGKVESKWENGKEERNRADECMLLTSSFIKGNRKII